MRLDDESVRSSERLSSRRLRYLAPGALTALLVVAGCGGSELSEDASTSTAAGNDSGGSEVLLVHRVDCYCTTGYRTSTTVFDDGRAETRFIGEKIDPVRFRLTAEETADLEAALDEVDFPQLPEQIKRGGRVGTAIDARKIRITSDGHTVRERPFFRFTGGLANRDIEPIPFVLGPVDDLVEHQLKTVVRPQVVDN